MQEVRGEGDGVGRGGEGRGMVMYLGVGNTMPDNIIRHMQTASNENNENVALMMNLSASQ